MSEATHTPGPWEIGEVIVNGDQLDEESAIIFLPDGGEITVETTMSMADAVLVAAAPELLAALKAMMPALEWKEGGNGTCMLSIEKTALRAARAAIVKAEGAS